MWRNYNEIPDAIKFWVKFSQLMIGSRYSTARLRNQVDTQQKFEVIRELALAFEFRILLPCCYCRSKHLIIITSLPDSIHDVTFLFAVLAPSSKSVFGTSLYGMSVCLPYCLFACKSVRFGDGEEFLTRTEDFDSQILDKSLFQHL